MRRIALVNQKGGVGKTTTAVNLSAAISKLDRRVLLVDLDPQSNATVSLGIPPDQQKNTTYALLNGGPFEPLKLSDTFHLVPSNIELAGAEMELTSVIGREIVLRDALADIKGYDFVILDCSPSLGLLSVNALTTAKEVMVPLQCEFLALHGISLLIRTVDLVRKRLNPELSITGVIPCMYDSRKGLARDVVVEIEKHFGSKVFKSKIRSNVRLAEAPSHGKTIFDYAPDSFGAEDYLSLAREIVGIEAIQRVTAPLAVAEPTVATILPPDLEIPIPVPELVVAGGMAEAAAPVVDVPPPAPAAATEPYSSAPMAEPVAEHHIPAPTVVELPPPTQAIAPVLEAPAPIAAEPYSSAPMAEPVAEHHIPAPTVVELPPPTQAIAPVLEAPAPIAAEPYSSAPMAEPVAERYTPAPEVVELPPPMQAITPVLEAPAPVVAEHDIPATLPEPAPIEPVVEASAPIVAEAYIPAPLPEPVAESDSPAAVSDMYIAVPLLETSVAQAPIAAEPVQQAPAPEIQATPTLDIVSDGVVEFIELIPLEIEELPYIEPERSV